jgi:hypothetical protein
MNRNDLLLAGIGLAALLVFVGINHIRDRREAASAAQLAHADAEQRQADRRKSWERLRGEVMGRVDEHMAAERFDEALAAMQPWDDLLSAEERGIRNAARRLIKQPASNALADVGAREVNSSWQPVRSAWDGTYGEAVRWVERAALSPDSVEFQACTPAVLVQGKWKTTCRWSWVNAYGVRIEKSLTFLMVEGLVVETF